MPSYRVNVSRLWRQGYKKGGQKGPKSRVRVGGRNLVYL
jgi:hypothetical protein